MVETNFLPLVKLRPLKPEKGRLLDVIALNASFDLVFVFELPQISSSNLLQNKSLDVLSASTDS